MARAVVSPRLIEPDAQRGLGGSIVRALPQGRGLPAGAWERRHRGLLAVLWLHVVGVPIFGLAMGYRLDHTLLEGSILLAGAVTAQWDRLGARIRSGVLSVGLLTASGLLVHFSGGYIEFHFHFFVMIALLSLYVDWVPFLVAVGYVALHHGIVGILDTEAVYNHPDAIAHPWKWAGIHAGFVLAAGAANVFTWRISEEEARRRENVERVTEAALAKLPLDELLEELLRRIRETVQGEMASIWLKEPDGLALRATHGSERPAKKICLPLDEGLHAEVVSTAQPVASSDVDPSSLLNPLYRAAGVRALAGAPLMVEGTLIGVLDVANRHPRLFAPSDLGLLQLVADRIGPAIDRARLYEAEHRIATTLQRSLLPKRLPDVPGIELAARYIPAGDDVAVGGDWYDAIQLNRGRLVLVMGDVAGHGTEAASLMGQLRTAGRAYASEGHSPGAVATRLNTLIAGLEDGSMATLLYLQLDVASGRLLFVNAGHPPPLVRDPSGAVEYVWRRPAPPLGARQHSLYTEHELTLRPGSTIVLYTDGLIERRGAPLDDGLRMLEQRLATAVASTAEDACCHVLGNVASHQSLADDVAVLVLRIADSPSRSLTMDYPADVSAVTTARRALEDFLRGAGVPEPELHDVVLSCTEACANAVQHAYGPAGGRFTLTATLDDDDAVHVSVRDTGSWRRENEVTGGGRGLLLMRALTDEVELDRSEAGTTLTLHKHLNGRGRDGRAG